MLIGFKNEQNIIPAINRQTYNRDDKQMITHSGISALMEIFTGLGSTEDGRLRGREKRKVLWSECLCLSQIHVLNSNTQVTALGGGAFGR